MELILASRNNVKHPSVALTVLGQYEGLVCNICYFEIFLPCKP